MADDLEDEWGEGGGGDYPVNKTVYIRQYNVRVTQARTGGQAGLAWLLALAS